MQAHTFFRAGAAPSTAARFLPAGFAGALPAGFAGIPRYNVRNVCADEYYVVNIFFYCCAAAETILSSSIMSHNTCFTKGNT